ncbi:MAG: hypothetical protein HYX83_00170 [Chloroflexi bacterium]|nr:hypothetical protein [Chloroflexota bacterium]
MDADTLVKMFVDKHENEYGGDSGDNRYKNAVKYFSGLDHIGEPLVWEILTDFLYIWGRMGRVLGREKFSSWQMKATGIIRSNNRILKRFQAKAIEEEILNTHKAEIISLYESFNEAVGPIASAKILHVICPDFFPLWDNAIADALRAELVDSQGNSFNTSISPFSGEDYFRFMEGTKLFMLGHRNIISQLANRYNKTKLRIIDECFWQAARRPFYICFKEQI